MHDTLRIVLKVAALAPAFLLGLPAQALLNRLGAPGQRRLPMLFHRYVCRVLGVRITIAGGLPAQGPMLLVANHVSWLDIPVIASLMPLSFVAKSEVADWPIFGWLARLQRTVFVERSRRQATGAAAETIAGRLAAGEAIVLFAEGTTGDGFRVLPYRSALLGAARNGDQDAARPTTVEPVAIVYTRRGGLPLTRREMPFIAWYGDMDLLPHLKALLAGGPVDVTVSFAPGVAFSTADQRKAIAADAEAFARSANRNARRWAGRKRLSIEETDEV